MSKAKKLDLSGYQLESHEEGPNPRKYPTKRFSNGGYVIHANGFDAYDHRGRFLGIFASQDVAERSAQDGRVSDLMVHGGAGELSWRVMWNDAVDSGSPVLQAGDGTQLMRMEFSDVFMVVFNRDGFEFDWLTADEVVERYGSEDEAFSLVFADRPFDLS